MRSNRHPSSRRSTKRSGLSLVEVAFSTALVGTLLVTALSTSAFHAKNATVLSKQAMAQQLADRLLNELAILSFAEPGTSGGTLGVESGETTANRSTWDDVDDANGFSASPPKSRSNTNRSGMTGFTESVTVQYLNPATLAVSSSATSLKKVTVTISGSGFASVVLTTLVASKPSEDPISQTTSRARLIELNSTQFSDSLGPAVPLRNEPVVN